MKATHRRELPSRSHKQIWKKFERILMFRTNFFFFIRLVLEVFGYISKSNKVQRSRRYIEDGTLPFNKSFVETTFIYFEVAYTALMFGRIIPLLISIKWPRVTKYMVFYQYVMEFIYEIGLPTNRGYYSVEHLNLLI